MSGRDYFPKKRATPPRPDAPTFKDAVWAVLLDVQLLARPADPLSTPQPESTT